jgi:hypothetical protein
LKVCAALTMKLREMPSPPPAARDAHSGRDLPPQSLGRGYFT